MRERRASPLRRRLAEAKPRAAARINRDHKLADGLIAYWPFVERGGYLVHDARGRWNAIASAGRTWGVRGEPPAVGPVLQLDGVDDLVYVRAGQSELMLASRFSLWALLVPTATPAQFDVAAGTADSTGRGYRIWTTDAGAPVRWCWQVYDGAAQQVFSAAAIAVGRLASVVGVHRGTSIELYVNGVSQGTQASADVAYGGSGNVAVTALGAMPWNASGTRFWRYWPGDYAAAGLWDRALSASEVWELYRDPYGLLLRPEPQAYQNLGTGNPPPATPTILHPIDATAGYRPREALLVQWTPYSGGGALTHVGVSFWDASGGGSEVWGTGLRPLEAGRRGDGWAWVWMEDARLSGGGTYWVEVQVRDDTLPPNTATSARAAITMAAEPLTDTRRRLAS